LEQFKTRADRIRSYIEDPSIGLEGVENLLDIARALYLQRSHYLRIKQSSSEYDILLFIRDNNPLLKDWEKDVLTIVDEEAKYFLPQLETKIMNEGWAVYWHYKILNSLDLPDGVHQGFIMEHNRLVTRPKKGGFINPYYVGFKIWQDIEKRWGLKRIFFSREIDRDVSFLRQYLTRELMEEMDIFQHEAERGQRVIAKISDEENWKEVKETLIRNVGVNGIPVIKIVDADFMGQQGLVLEHEHDGRDLFQEYTFKTLEHIQKLWRRKVYLTTMENGEVILYKCTHNKIKRVTPRGGGQSDLVFD